MATDTRIDNSAAVAACDAIVDLIDGGAGAGFIRIYTGSAPTNVDAAASGEQLCQLTCNDPAFGNAADADPGATATANAITADSSASASGTAGYFRAFDSDTNAILQGTCGTSNADMILNTTAIVSAAEVSISSWTVTMPESS